jgi:hypothetical protein
MLPGGYNGGVNRALSRTVSSKTTPPRKPAALATETTDKVTFVIYGNEMFRLCKAIRVRPRRVGGLYVLEYKPLGIAAYGRSEQESREAFAEEFSSCWHWIALEDDAALTKDARELKYKVLDLVKTVTSLR